MAKFEFYIEGVTKEQAEKLIDFARFLFVECLGLKMAGGVIWEADNEETEAVSKGQ